MPTYMTQFAYTPEAWATLAKKPEDRTAIVSKLLEQFGCRVLHLYYSLGEYDGVLIAEGPDEVSMSAALIAAIAPGHLKATKTTTLLSAKQAVEAMTKAGGKAFRGPGG